MCKHHVGRGIEHQKRNAWPVRCKTVERFTSVLVDIEWLARGRGLNSFDAPTPAQVGA